MINAIITDADRPILNRLKHIDFHQSHKPHTIEVEFHFHKNDYFPNEVLKTKIHIVNNVPEKVEGTKI